MVYDIDLGEVTEERVNLGRALFYDKTLSSDSSISCGSCHQIEYAMSDRHNRLSLGVNERIGTRNSPSIFNLAWQNDFMWDGGVNHIEFIAVAPIENPLEMDLSFVKAIGRLNQNPFYKTEFKKTFDVDQISDKEFLLAISQFMMTMVSADSKYDQVVQKKSQFTETEHKGFQLYKQHCSDCHTEPLFFSNSFKNNGLDTSYIDLGRQRITSKPEDIGKFKVPSLRNLAYTFPYMHDGRFNTLDEVLNHYSEGIISKTTSSSADVTNMNLNDEDKSNIIAFLKTLNDKEFVNNKALDDPYE